MKTVIEMAREAGFKEHNGMIYVTTINDDCAKELKALVDLARADERNRTWTQEHWTEYEHSIVADERNSWPAEMEAMERQVNILTDALAEAKADERECIFQELIRMHENTKGAHNYFLHAVGTIRARRTHDL